MHYGSPNEGEILAETIGGVQSRFAHAHKINYGKIPSQGNK